MQEEEEMFEFVQDDMELFNQLDFIREDFAYKHSNRTQQKLKRGEAIRSTGVVPLFLSVFFFVVVVVVVTF